MSALSLIRKGLRLVLVWLLVLGMNNVEANSGECEAVISGPLHNEWRPQRLTVTVLEMNETHPARVRCQATCLNQQGTYSPAMAIIVTSQEKFIPVHDRFYYSRDDLHFEVRTGNISYCEAQNNYTMEYEYLITSNSSKIDRSVVICGVNTVTSHISPPYSPHTCWRQSYYGIIRAEVDTRQAPTNPSSDKATYTTVTGSICCLSVGHAGSQVYILMSIMIVIIIILFMTTLLLILRLRYQSLIKNSPSCVQTVKQSLVIKVEQPVASESAAVREKETSFSAESDSSRPSIQAQLQEKLPDTISSRSKTL